MFVCHVMCVSHMNLVIYSVIYVHIEVKYSRIRVGMCAYVSDKAKIQAHMHLQDH